MDPPSPEREAAARGLAAATADLAGEPGRKPVFHVTDSGTRVLWGDLFRTGRHCFALVEVPDMGAGDGGVAFGEWVNGAWSPQQAWRIGTVWRPEGWKREEDYLPTTPATEPFSLEDFSGDGVPEVMIAGGVSRYFQEYHLLHWSPKTGELNLVASAMARPERVEDYVRLYFDSGRRSIWSEWEFARWKGAELETVASWHGETGYNESDPTFSEGMRRGPDGRPVTIRVLYGHGHESEERYQLSRNGEPFGTLRITWKNPERPPENADEVEAAWLFEKITGLPRRLYPAREGAAPLGKFEDFATVTVEGNAAAAELFQGER